jgi:hypothetical protein
MLVLRSPDDASRITDAPIRQLVETRFRQLAEDDGTFDSERCGFMVVVEPGDPVDELEHVTGVDVLADVFGESRFGDPGFAPAAEAITEHEVCFEIVFVFNDDAYGLAVFVPKVEGAAPQLLAMCRQFASPASARPSP